MINFVINLISNSSLLDKMSASCPVLGCKEALLLHYREQAPRWIVWCPFDFLNLTEHLARRLPLSVQVKVKALPKEFIEALVL